MNFWLIVLEICCGIFIQLPLRIGEEIQEEEYHFLEEKAKHLPKYISSILVLLKISLSGLRLSWERFLVAIAWTRDQPAFTYNHMSQATRPNTQTFYLHFRFDQPNECLLQLMDKCF